MEVRLMSMRSLPLKLFPRVTKPRLVHELHHHVLPSNTIPSPTPFVPDVTTFLTLIGRNMSQHAAKFPTWESLFSLSSRQLRALGVEPPRSRRYLLWWRDRFKRGIYGPGGDLKYINNATAVLEAVNPPPNTANGAKSLRGVLDMKKIVVNVPSEGRANLHGTLESQPVHGMKVVGAQTVVGPSVQLVKGTAGRVATFKMREGLWEEKRGHKVKGGERKRRILMAIERRKKKQEEGE